MPAPSLRAKPAVDFYCYYPIHIYDWAPIVRSLRARGVDARLVIDPPGRNRANQVVEGVRRDNVDEATFAMLVHLCLDEGLVPLLHCRYKTADAVIANCSLGLIGAYEGKKIRVQYGVSAITDSYAHSSVNSGFDGVLVHGPWSQEQVSQWGTEARIVGFPKFQAEHGSDADHWRKHWNLDPTKQTIAYFSTWSTSSTLDRYANEVEALAEHYNVIYKPHPLNQRFEQNRYAAMRRSHVVVADDVHNIVPFISVADLVIADDRSGSFTEPMIFDKPVIGLSATGNVEEDKLTELGRNAAPICTSPAELRSLVEEMLTHDEWSSGRRALRDRCFADLHGNDSAVAADAIVELTGIEATFEEPELQLPPQPAVTVVVRSNGDEVELLRCLDSLRQQTDAPDMEVMVVSTAKLPEEITGAAAWPFPVWFPDATSDMTANGETTIVISDQTVAGTDFVAGHAHSHTLSPGTLLLAPVTNGAPVPTDLLSSMGYEYAVRSRDFGGNVSFPTSRFQLPVQWFRRRNAVTDLLQRAEEMGMDQVDVTHAACRVPKPASVLEVQQAIQSLGRAGALITARHGISALPFASLPEDADGLRRVAEDMLQKTSDATFVLEEVAHVCPDITTQFSGDAPAAQEGMRGLVDGAFDHLLPVWTAQGAAQVLSATGSTSLPALRDACAQLVPTTALTRYLAWPDYSSDKDLDALMARAVTMPGDPRCICLMHHEPVDGSLDEATARIEAAYVRNLPEETDLEMCFVIDGRTPAGRRRLPYLIDAVMALPSLHHGDRAQMARELDLPIIR